MLWACLLAVRVATLRSAIVISFRIGFVKRQQHQCARYQHCNGYYDCHGSPFSAWKAESSRNETLRVFIVYPATCSRVIRASSSSFDTCNAWAGVMRANKSMRRAITPVHPV